MFFSSNILLSKNSNFAIIWKYMYDRHGTFKVSKRDLLSINIERACEDLINYIPTGQLLKSELRNKMSLYLLGQLTYGITLVLKTHADYLIVDLQAVIKSLARHPEEEKLQKTPRKSAGRKRRITELDGVVEEAIALRRRGLEPEELEEDEEEGAKRRRASTARKSLLLNLADPRAYVDQQLPVREAPDGALLMDEGSRLDDMFMDQSMQPVLPPPEWAPETNMALSPPIGDPVEEGRHGSQKVSMFSILAGPGEDTLIREVEQTVTVSSSFSITHAPNGSVEANGLELPVHEREPIYKRAADEHVTEIVGDSADRLQLDALPDIVPTTRPPNKKKKRLLVDEQLELSNRDMVARMQNFNDLVRTRDDLHKEIALPDLPTLSQLLSPRPCHIKALSSELYPLFDSVRADFRDRPLTFVEAQAMTFEDFRKRGLDNDLGSWHSNDTTPLMQRLEKSFGALVVEQEQQHEKVSMSEALIRQRSSSAMEAERERRATRDTGNESKPHDAQINALEMDQSMPTPQGPEFSADTELLQESVMSKDRSMAVWDERSADDNTRELYSRIVRGGVVSFEELLRSDSFGETKKLTRAAAARKFFALLNLLKHHKVKVRQRKPYGEILIRSRTNLEDGGEEQQSFIMQE